MKSDFSKIHHKHILLKSFRTALLFISGFIVYELAMELEDQHTSQNKSRLKTIRSKLLKFVIIFTLDILILYALYFATGEYY
jgi:uncharacterized membrane protein YidH (DUF202 family)